MCLCDVIHSLWYGRSSVMSVWYCVSVVLCVAVGRTDSPLYVDPAYTASGGQSGTTSYIVFVYA